MNKDFSKFHQNTSFREQLNPAFPAYYGGNAEKAAGSALEKRF